MKLSFIDLFCGAGGVTTGIHQARVDGRAIAEVLACVNHDLKAIQSHQSNHPDCLHYVEDIRTLDLSGLTELTNLERINDPDAVICLWASLECTNFSKAKGGQPRNADSRTLAEHLFRYIEELNPDYIWIENVEEFMSWGPLDENGKPISRKSGRDYLRWIGQVQSYGYAFDYRILNCADFGAYTSRKRYFAQFAKEGMPIKWPVATHSKKGFEEAMLKDLEESNPSFQFSPPKRKWRPVKDVLDFSDEGVSIFEGKQRSENSLERILAGLIKHVAGGKESFIAKYNSYSPTSGYKHCAVSVDEPCHTISTQVRMGLVQPCFLIKYHGTGENIVGIDETCSTLTTKDRLAFVNAKYYVDKAYGGKENHQSIQQPAGSIVCNDKHQLVKCCFIDKQFSSGGRDQSIEQPAGAILTIPKENLVTCKRWVMNTNFNNIGSSIEEPSAVITANRKQHYLMNPQFLSAGGSIENPCFTLIAKMDKRPPYLITTEKGEVAIQIYDTDSPATVKIKEFMAMYGIVDIKMRMLRVPELLRIQGFGDTYTLVGNQADQKKFIGNSVPPPMVKALIEACYSAIQDLSPVTKDL